MLFLHFVINTIEVLRPPLNLSLYPHRKKLLLQNNYNILNIGFSLGPFFCNPIYQFIIIVWLNISKRKVFQLPLQFVYSEAVSQRSEYFQGFIGNFLLFGRVHMFESPHIMDSVSQLNQDYPDIFSHSQEHFPQVFYLLLHFVFILNPAQFGYPINQQSNLWTKMFFYSLQCYTCIFYHIMQQSRYNSNYIKLQISKNHRYI